MKLWLCFCALVSVLATLPARGGTFVQFRTQFGDIDVELYDQDKPVTVKNFLRYVEAGLYTNMIAHRAVTNFVIQGGGKYVANRTTTPSIVDIPTFPPIVNEFSTGKFYSNKYGTIAMAKTSDPNSATSQFFFNLADNSFSLDNTANSGGFTVFGRVVRGTDVLDKLNIGHPTRVVKRFGPTSELPIKLAANPALLSAEDVVYFDVTLLKVGVTKANNSAQISWTSVNAKTNFVEFTTTFPPTWQPLSHVMGNGGVTTVTDNAVGFGKRFYRVRVAY